MKFRSKVDWCYYLLFVGWIIGNLWAIVSLIISHGLGALITTITFTPFTVFFFIPICFNLYYLLDDDELKTLC